MNKYSHCDWNGKTGTIPVFWNKEHYIDVGWYEHNDKAYGFSTDLENYQIYGKNIGVLIPTILDPIFERAFDFFDLGELVFGLSRYTPGMLLPWHTDNYPTYSRNKQVADIEKVVRIMVFLEDSKPGHQLWIEDRLCYGPAGSWYAWQGRTLHMSANLGKVDRYALQITGLLQ